MTSQLGEQTISIHILPNILRIKGNQTLKFGQVIECNNRNIFPEISCKKKAEILVPDPFLFLKML